MIFNVATSVLNQNIEHNSKHSLSYETYSDFCEPQNPPHIHVAVVGSKSNNFYKKLCLTKIYLQKLTTLRSTIRNQPFLYV